jgi:hypothetical protein
MEVEDAAAAGAVDVIGFEVRRDLEFQAAQAREE